MNSFGNVYQISFDKFLPEQHFENITYYYDNLLRRSTNTKCATCAKCTKTGPT